MEINGIQIKVSDKTEQMLGLLKENLALNSNIKFNRLLEAALIKLLIEQEHWPLICPHCNQTTPELYIQKDTQQDTYTCPYCDETYPAHEWELDYPDDSTIGDPTDPAVAAALDVDDLVLELLAPIPTLELLDSPIFLEGF